VRYWATRSARLDLLPPEVDLESALIVDLGANHGGWSSALLKVAPRARVVAVEPAPEPGAQLEARFGGDDRVTVDRRAVAAGPGTADFHVTAHSHNSSLRVPDDNVEERYGDSGWAVARTIQVETTSLDDIVGDRDVALLKIDVQGGEREVLAGAARTLPRTGAVLLEITFVSHYSGDATFPELHQLMTGAGFELAAMSEPERTADGMLAWADACYLRR
jgi:FkbM family methyltransferase